MAPKTPSHTTQTTEVKLPEWVEGASQENYELAKNIAQRPLTQYQGSRVADQSNLTSQAYQMLQGGLDVNSWLNPETANVEQRALDAGNRALTSGLNQNADAARAARAFGGSRHGIVDAVSTAENARNMGDLSATLRKQAYDSAVQNAMGDRQFRVSGLLGAGMQEQGQRQRLIDADMAKFYEQRDYALEGLNTRLAALGMSPYGKSETSSRTTSGGSGGADWASAGLGFLQMLPMLAGLSDRKDKEDIKKLGKVNGIDIYAYRYKGDPKSYPKVIGPMAQDIEKASPEMVREIGGHKVVGFFGG